MPELPEGLTYEEEKRIAELRGYYVPSPEEIREAKARIKAGWKNGLQKSHSRHRISGTMLD